MKTLIRHKYLKQRNELTEEFVTTSAANFTKEFLHSDFAKISENKSIMLYSSFRNEADTWALINYFYEQKIKVVLPAISGSIIIPYEYNGKDSLKKDSFGILSPNQDLCKKANIQEIQTIIVPGIVFSKKGDRIGFGKGYYDRFLPDVPNAVKIGLCYEFQIIPSFPSDEFDIPMDYLLTEKGFINCKTQNYINQYNK